MHLLQAFTGGGLWESTGSGYFSSLRDLGLSLGSAEAIQRIFDAYGMLPDRSGSNVPGIVSLRDALWDALPDKSMANGLAIIAPHTHWEAAQPVVISWHKTYYIIGHQPLRSEATYLPVSFLLTNSGPLPFEWVDDSIQLDRQHIDTIWRALEILCQGERKMDTALGITLNFRFKELLALEPMSTVEHQSSNDGFATISRARDVDYSWNNPAFGQVAWHAFSDKDYRLSSDQASLLGELRLRLGVISDPEDADRMLTEAVQKLVREGENHPLL